MFNPIGITSPKTIVDLVATADRCICYAGCHRKIAIICAIGAQPLAAASARQDVAEASYRSQHGSRAAMLGV